MLAESVCFLQEMKPNPSTGDAMWFLLVSNMNISHVYVMEADHAYNIVSDEDANRTPLLSYRRT